MRKARITWEGAFHHVMNRGLNKQKIFSEKNMKEKYIKLLAELSEKFDIKIFAYCVMDNHFHIALENTSGKLSQFMRNLNGQYGNYYRKTTNSKGYVFEDRFKSTIVQNITYLNTLILYILLNPVRKEYLINPLKYKWSSAGQYFENGKNCFIDKMFVEDIYESKGLFVKSLINNKELQLNEVKSQFGKILGENDFINIIELSTNIKENNLTKEEEVKNKIEKIIADFEIENSIKISNINIQKKKGKRLRGKLLLKLKSNSFLRNRDIIQISLFEGLKINSLKTLYSREKKRL